MNDTMLLLQMIRSSEDASRNEQVRGSEGGGVEDSGSDQDGDTGDSVGADEDRREGDGPGDNGTQGPDGLHDKYRSPEEVAVDVGRNNEGLGSDVEEESDAEVEARNARERGPQREAGFTGFLVPGPGETSQEFMLRMQRASVSLPGNSDINRHSGVGAGHAQRYRKDIVEQGVVLPVHSGQIIEETGGGSHVLTGEPRDEVRLSVEGTSESHGREEVKVHDRLERERKEKVGRVGPKESRQLFWEREVSDLTKKQIMTGRKKNMAASVVTGFLEENPTPMPDDSMSREYNAARCGPEIYETTYDVSPFIDPQDTTLETPSDGILRRLGGKRQLAAWLVSRFPDTYAYVEPFGGSMKVLLSKPRRSKVEIVNDIDCDMIHFFLWARHNPDKLCDFINSMPCHEALALGCRHLLAEGKLSGLDRAAGFWLGYQTGFNAMVSDGRYGSSVQSLLDTRISRDRIAIFSKRMMGVDIRSTDYRRIINSANKSLSPSSYPPGKVFFYLDPPYDQTEGYSTMAGKSTFGWSEQSALADLCARIHQKGNLFIQTNSSTDRLKKLYSSFTERGKPIFHLMERNVMYSVSGKASARGDATELIISNWELRDSRQGGLFG
ncbi:MAG: hypothetical protein CL484_12030 [Acidobacteria bacterium]|nr:hypothetical protein [Acidobacteriota bacterium]